AFLEGQRASGGIGPCLRDSEHGLAHHRRRVGGDAPLHGAIGELPGVVGLIGGDKGLEGRRRPVKAADQSEAHQGECQSCADRQCPVLHNPPPVLDVVNQLTGCLNCTVCACVHNFHFILTKHSTSICCVNRFEYLCPTAVS